MPQNYRNTFILQKTEITGEDLVTLYLKGLCIRHSYHHKNNHGNFECFSIIHKSSSDAKIIMTGSFNYDLTEKDHKNIH